MEKIKIAISGAIGRMGRALIQAVMDAPDALLTGALVRSLTQKELFDASLMGKTDSSIVVTDQISQGLLDAEFLIDFTRPTYTLKLLENCVQRKIGMVIGTTGFDASQKQLILEASKVIPIVLAPNMSLGVNVFLALIEQATKNLGSKYEVEILEAHHRHKEDSPSGTALKMGDTVAKARNVSLDTVAVYGDRKGPRPVDAIGFSVIRGGDMFGEHTAFFIGNGERIEITHRSGSRNAYAQGAVQACRFLKHHIQKSPNSNLNSPLRLFDMKDVFFD